MAKRKGYLNLAGLITPIKITAIGLKRIAYGFYFKVKIKN